MLCPAPMPIRSPRNRQIENRSDDLAAAEIPCVNDFPEAIHLPAAAAAYRGDVNGTNFTVAITALPAGKYTLTIGAAETSARAAGERVFDITSGDTVLAKDFDILAKAGAARKVATISGTVDHADDSVRGPLKI